jgi:hypothetical protein
MVSKPLVAVLDACVLYPFHLRNVLVQAAFDGLFDARMRNGYAILSPTPPMSVRIGWRRRAIA